MLSKCGAAHGPAMIPSSRLSSLSVLLAAIALVFAPLATHAGWEDGDNAEILHSNYDLTWIGSAPDRASGMLVAA